MNVKGPKLEPCGTPYVIIYSISTYWRRPISKVQVFLFKTITVHFWSRILWSIQSKAFWKFIYATSTWTCCDNLLTKTPLKNSTSFHINEFWLLTFFFLIYLYFIHISVEKQLTTNLRKRNIKFFLKYFKLSNIKKTHCPEKKQ